MSWRMRPAFTAASSGTTRGSARGTAPGGAARANEKVATTAVPSNNTGMHRFIGPSSWHGPVSVPLLFYEPIVYKTCKDGDGFCEDAYKEGRRHGIDGY